MGLWQRFPNTRAFILNSIVNVLNCIMIYNYNDLQINALFVDL